MADWESGHASKEMSSEPPKKSMVGALAVIVSGLTLCLNDLLRNPSLCFLPVTTDE